MATHIALGMLGLAGFFISLYFTLVYYGILQPDWGFIPRVCRMDKQTCGSLIHTREARLLGLPNSVFGIGFYLFVIVTSVCFSGESYAISLQILFWASIIAVAMGIYLTYSLMVKLRTKCVLCFASHTINLLILLILYFSLA
ncbi:MAG TPA: vitamin K epoxide reductase family protein [Bacteroidota bacterium]|nr:vitamin K epoxide reductase family protein [Bacteroidota bacterium]